MEEMSPAVAVTLSLSNSICDNSGITSPLEITRLKLVTETANLLTMATPDGGTGGKSELEEMIPKSERGWIANDVTIQESEEDVLNVGDDSSGMVGEELLTTDTSLPIAVEIEKIETGEIVTKVISLGEPSIVQKPTIDVLTLASIPNEIEKGQIGRCGKSVFELEYIPLWGSVSICGKRAEMEDAVVAVPWFMKIPIKMFVGDHVINGLSQSLSHITTHFFGVYDGHGGSQVRLLPLSFQNDFFLYPVSNSYYETNGTQPDVLRRILFLASPLSMWTHKIRALYLLVRKKDFG